MVIRRRGALRYLGLGLVIVWMLVLSACASSSSGSGLRAESSTSTAAPAGGEDLLGPVNAASGEPVKIGFISDGKSSFLDNTIEIRAAEATTKWLNERGGGIAGRPIQLDTCETKGEPATAADCGRQMVQDNVAAVAFKEVTGVEAMWTPLHDAGIPVMGFTSQLPLSADAQSTYILNDSTTAGVQIPLGVAKQVGADKVTVVIIDVPGAADTVKSQAGPAFEEAGIDLEFVRIAPGTADMTSQLSSLASDGTDVAFVVGYDAFCIAAFKGLSQVGYTGSVASIEQCFSDATRTALTPDELEGITLWSPTAIGDTSDPDTQLFAAVMNKYGPGISTTDSAAFATFATLTALHDGLAGLTGDVTPASVNQALKSMPSTPLRAGGNREFRCNGKAVPEFPAVCTRGALVSTLDAQGNPKEYQLVNSSPIPD